MTTRRIRITGTGLYGQPTDDNPTGEYPVGHEFETQSELPASWKGRAIVVGDEPKGDETFVVNEDDDSEAGQVRNAVIREANAKIDQLKADHLADTAMLRDRAERAEADLARAKEQIEALTLKLNGPAAGDATGDEIATAVGMLDAGNDAHWTAAGLPAVDAVAELIGKPVTRAAITDAAPDAKRPS